MFDILSLWFNPRPRQGRRNPSTARRNRFRPSLEPLEDRMAPAVFNVNSTTDILNPPAGVVTLRSAIQAANATSDPAGNFINLTVAGTYKITIPGALEDNNATGDFDIIPHANGNLTITNTSGGGVTVDGNHLDRVFDINPGDTNNAATKNLVTMQGFTITNGDAFDPANPDGPTSTGGGIRDQGNTSLTLTNMVLTNNVASADGGGVVMENVVNIGTWTLTINNSTFSNNHAGDTGGGIDTDGTGTVIINPGTVITGNTDVNQGAGVYIDTIAVGATFPGASMMMTGAVVSDNQALASGVTASGGGISNAGNGTMTIVNSTVANNFSGGTGGGFSDENNVGTLVVSNSLFLDNSAVMDGGGIQEGGPSTTITNTAIRGNTSSATGGGLFLNGTAVSIQTSTIVGNTAVGGGGGIEIQTTGTGASGTTITNSTITANSATANAAAAGTANGGGIEAPAATFTGSLALLNDTINGNFATSGGGIFWGGNEGSAVALQNTIVANNFAGTGPDANNPARTFTDNGGNLIGVSGAGSGNTGFTAATTQTGTTATPLNPQLGPLTNNGGPTVGSPGATVALETEAPLSTSPAIDKGVSAGSPPADERGLLRPDNGAGEKPDVGAFEFQDVTLAVNVQATTPSVKIGATATFAIVLTNTSQNTLPLDNSTVTVTLSSGLKAAGPLSFALGALAPGQSATFMVTATAPVAGAQSIAVAISSVDINPNFIVTGAAVMVTPPRTQPPPFVSVALTPVGEVLELVDANGNLVQFDPFGAHFLGSGFRSASVAFGSFGAVLVTVTQTGVMTQFDAFGAHPLGGGVLDASVALGPFGEVLDVVTTDGVLRQFDAFGVHFLGSGVLSVGVAISSAAGEVLEVAYTNGSLIQYDLNGAHPLLGGVLCASAAFNITPPQGATVPIVPMPGLAFVTPIEVLDVVFTNGLLEQFDAFGVHPLAKLF